MKCIILILLLSMAISGSDALCDTGSSPIAGSTCIQNLCNGCDANNLCCGPDSSSTLSSSFLTTTPSTGAIAAGCIGPCIANSCPTSFTCNTVSQQCCSGSSSAPCRDIIGPKGFSDCPRLANLCNNQQYYTIMTQQCPKTCGRCGSSSSSSGFPATSTNVTSSTNCVDRSRPNGVSDCPQLAYLCNNPQYRKIMSQQCPRTCGRCSGTSSTIIG